MPQAAKRLRSSKVSYFSPATSKRNIKDLYAKYATKTKNVCWMSISCILGKAWTRTSNPGIWTMKVSCISSIHTARSAISYSSMKTGRQFTWLNTSPAISALSLSGNTHTIITISHWSSTSEEVIICVKIIIVCNKRLRFIKLFLSSVCITFRCIRSALARWKIS